MRRAWIHVGLLVLIFAGFLALDRGQPLVRNGLVYARAAWNVIEAGYDPRPVVADSRRSYDKPIGFAWMAAPLVAGLGAHDGLRVASLLGTVAYVLATLYFARTFLPPASRERGTNALLWLAAFGPLVVYQAWSAHPDSWFAALFVLSVALTHRIATGDDARVAGRALALGGVLLAAFLLKNYALILVPACALYLLAHVRALARDGRSVAKRAIWCAAALAIVAGFILAARFGRNPLSRLEGEGGGADQYAFREIGSIWWKTVAQCGIALLLQLHVTSFAAFRRTSLARDVVLPWCCFGLPYVAGLLPFPTAFYNMRYFMPLFPLAALAIVRGAETMPQAARRFGTIAFLVVNSATTLLFNAPSLFDAVRPGLPDAKVEWLANGPPLSLLDSLRMEQHRDQDAWLRTIRERLEPGAVLYMLDVVYYRDAQQQVFERDGFLRSDVTIRYASRRDFHPRERSFYVYSYPSGTPPLAALGRVTELGPHVFRVDAEPAPYGNP